MKTQLKNHSGFTLIELLVVISIVAVLSAVGLTTYQGTQSKARDSIRKNDLTKLATALELYAQQHNLTYIDGTPGAEGDCTSSDTTTFYTSIASYLSGNIVPKDPQTNVNYCYISVNNGQSFRLFAKLENCSDPNIIPGISCATADYNYSITSDDLNLAAVPAGTIPGPTPTPTLPTWYRDADDDTYGNPAVTTTAVSQPAGYAANNTDCDDANSNVKPGQTAYFTTSRANGSYDYDCDGIESKQYNCGNSSPAVSCTTSSADPGAVHYGYVSAAPTCGVSGIYRRCQRWLTSTSCSGSPNDNNSGGDCSLSPCIAGGGWGSAATVDASFTQGCR